MSRKEIALKHLFPMKIWAKLEKKNIGFREFLERLTNLLKSDVIYYVWKTSKREFELVGMYVLKE